VNNEHNNNVLPSLQYQRQKDSIRVSPTPAITTSAKGPAPIVHQSPNESNSLEIHSCKAETLPFINQVRHTRSRESVSESNSIAFDQISTNTPVDDHTRKIQNFDPHLPHQDTSDESVAHLLKRYDTVVFDRVDQDSENLRLPQNDPRILFNNASRSQNFVSISQIDRNVNSNFDQQILVSENNNFREQSRSDNSHFNFGRKNSTFNNPSSQTPELRANRCIQLKPSRLNNGYRHTHKLTTPLDEDSEESNIASPLQKLHPKIRCNFKRFAADEKFSSLRGKPQTKHLIKTTIRHEKRVWRKFRRKHH
jgi:hypothetical protein